MYIINTLTAQFTVTNNLLWFKRNLFSGLEKLKIPTCINHMDIDHTRYWDNVLKVRPFYRFSSCQTYAQSWLRPWTLSTSRDSISRMPPLTDLSNYFMYLTSFTFVFTDMQIFKLPVVYFYFNTAIICVILNEEALSHLLLFCLSSFFQVVFAGMMVSSSLWGTVCDKYGRKAVSWFQHDNVEFTLYDKSKISIILTDIIISFDTLLTLIHIFVR